MNQQLHTLEDMQADHRQWDYVHSVWRVDIEGWRTEHEQALSELARLQEIVRQHRNALEAHAEALERQQNTLRDHGRTMAELKGEAGGQLQEVLRKEHYEHAQRHRDQRAAHERIKKHHHTVMARLTMLRTAIEEAM